MGCAASSQRTTQHTTSEHHHLIHDDDHQQYATVVSHRGHHHQPGTTGNHRGFASMTTTSVLADTTNNNPTARSSTTSSVESDQHSTTTTKRNKKKTFVVMMTRGEMSPMKVLPLPTTTTTTTGGTSNNSPTPKKNRSRGGTPGHQYWADIPNAHTPSPQVSPSQSPGSASNFSDHNLENFARRGLQFGSERNLNNNFQPPTTTGGVPPLAPPLSTNNKLTLDSSGVPVFSLSYSMNSPLTEGVSGGGVAPTGVIDNSITEEFMVKRSSNQHHQRQCSTTSSGGTVSYDSSPQQVAFEPTTVDLGDLPPAANANPNLNTHPPHLLFHRRSISASDSNQHIVRPVQLSASSASLEGSTGSGGGKAAPPHLEHTQRQHSASTPPPPSAPPPVTTDQHRNTDEGHPSFKATEPAHLRRMSTGTNSSSPSSLTFSKRVMCSPKSSSQQLDAGSSTLGSGSGNNVFPTSFGRSVHSDSNSTTSGSGGGGSAVLMLGDSNNFSKNNFTALGPASNVSPTASNNNSIKQPSVLDLFRPGWGASPSRRQHHQLVEQQQQATGLVLPGAEQVRCERVPSLSDIRSVVSEGTASSFDGSPIRAQYYYQQQQQQDDSANNVLAVPPSFVLDHHNSPLHPGGVGDSNNNHYNLYNNQATDSLAASADPATLGGSSQHVDASVGGSSSNNNSADESNSNNDSPTYLLCPEHTNSKKLSPVQVLTPTAAGGAGSHSPLVIGSGVSPSYDDQQHLLEQN